MVEKKIHYCWFGGNELPDIVKKCIKSWQKHLPEYKIVCWDESNFDIETCPYVKEAYEAKKWAFVSDYARMYILYHYGGLYFDTDVEVIKSLEEILTHGPFMARESESPNCSVAPGLALYAEKGMPIYKEILDDYEKSHFVNEDGSYSYYTVVERVTNILKKHGLTSEDGIQKVAGLVIYPKAYFCPLDYGTGKLTLKPETCAIHWYSATWLDEKMQHQREVCMRLNNRFPKKMAKFLGDWYVRFSNFFDLVKKGNVKYIYVKIKKRFHH